MRRRVVVTGMGCISPVGNNVRDTWLAILDGKSGSGMITLFDASKHKTKFAAEVKGFDPAGMLGQREARKMDRFTQFATVATTEALEHAGLKIDESNRDRVGILIGTGIGGIGTMMDQADVMRERGPDRVPFSTCQLFTGKEVEPIRRRKPDLLRGASSLGVDGFQHGRGEQLRAKEILVFGIEGLGRIHISIIHRRDK